uniref:Uncharacterized protein n=1 Tax=Arundo donax TaxID=35708 RepID=A0A0A9GQE2_ARUDO
MPPSSIIHGTIIGEIFCSNFPRDVLFILVSVVAYFHC